MILFVVNDAGPAKYLAYIMKSLNSNEYLCLASDISSVVFCDFKIDFIMEKNKISLKDIDLVVTGTCLGNGIDKEFIEISKKNNIRVISIIEHWSLYKKRFEIKGEYSFPDVILLNDDIAKKEAIEDGVNENILKIIGNPVFENIAKQDYSLNDKIYWKNKLNIDSDKKIITFISEEYKKDFFKESLEYQGFNEFEVIEDIIQCLDENFLLLIKLHPAEDISKYSYYLEENNNIKIIKKVDIKKLISFSDIFVGMGSILLLEASMLRSDVFSYRPNEQIKFIGNKNGMTQYIDTKDVLKKIINSNYIMKNKTIKNNFESSTVNFIKFIEECRR